MNRHDFQQAAKKFRAGRLTLEDFANMALPSKAEQKQTERDGQNTNAKNESWPIALPQRPTDAHKGDFGRVLVVGGSDSMSGAIKLAGLAALRTGSGLVTVATPDTEQNSVESFSPCYMTIGFESSKGRFSKHAVDAILKKCEWADVVAMGPGMSTSKALRQLMKTVFRDLPQPVVIDADGLNNLSARDMTKAEEFDWGAHAGQRILTPHPGEFIRMIDSEITDRDALETEAIELAARANLTIVLKGHRTMVAGGGKVFHNQTGNSGMATAGSGDVLTGVIASLVGQGMNPFAAACSGVHLHGLAGDMAAQRFGEVSLISSDLLDFLPHAIQSKN